MQALTAWIHPITLLRQLPAAHFKAGMACGLSNPQKETCNFVLNRDMEVGATLIMYQMETITMLLVNNHANTKS